MGGTDEKMRQFVEQLQADVSAAQVRRIGFPPTVSRKLRVILRAVGRERRSRRVEAKLMEALAGAGLYADRNLSDPHLGPEDSVRFAASPFPPNPTLFASEKQLQDLVADLIARRVAPFHGLRLIEMEHRCAGHRFDLLAQDRSSGQFVIIEVKLSNDKGTGEQVRGYIDALRAREQSRSDQPGEPAAKPVRAVVILGDPLASRIELKAGYDVQTYLYRISFDPISG